GQRPLLAGTQARQAGGEETRTEILERGGRPVEQLQHVIVGGVQGVQRRREVEGFAADGGKQGLQRITGKKRLQQRCRGVRQGFTGLKFAGGRQLARHIQATIRRESGSH